MGPTVLSSSAQRVTSLSLQLSAPQPWPPPSPSLLPSLTSHQFPPQRLRQGSDKSHRHCSHGNACPREKLTWIMTAFSVSSGCRFTGIHEVSQPPLDFIFSTRWAEPSCQSGSWPGSAALRYHLWLPNDFRHGPAFSAEHSRPPHCILASASPVE